MKKHGLNRGDYQRLWASRLADLEESNLTQKQWCDQNGVAYSTLKYWVLKANSERRRRAETGDGKWLAINASGTSETNTGKITINCSVFRIEIDDTVNPDTLYNVLRVMREL